MRNRFKFLGIIVLTAVIGFSMSSCNNPTGADDRYRNGGGWGGSGGQEQPGVITWTAHPSGSPATNAIYIFFSRDPGSLSAGDFAITPAGGSATRGALSGSGITRRLAVSNVGSGAVSVSVNASNISGSQTVTLFAPGEGEPAAITWTAAPAGSPTTTHLTFSFGSDPGPLQASNFTIIAGSGSAARGALSGSGTTRTLMISNVREGSISVLINAPNIAGGSSLVTLVAPADTGGIVDTGNFWFDRATGTITRYNGTRAGHLTIPASFGGIPVTGIGNSAFEGNQLTSVTIPNSVTSIGSWAFAENQLASVTIPNSVTYIHWGAFAHNQLTSVTIPNSVTTIVNGAFMHNRLTSVTIPNSVTRIQNNTFRHNQLTSVTIPNSVIDIGGGAFADNQLTSITIGANVQISEQHPAFGGNFERIYIHLGRLAGTYTRPNANSTVWTRH